MYRELCHIAKIIICLPVSNAWPERGGSAIKKIKTRLRSCLKHDMMSALLHVSTNEPEVLEADEFVKEATIRWTGLEKRTKLPGHITTTRNTMTCVERNNVSVQTDCNFNILDTELAEKEEHDCDEVNEPGCKDSWATHGFLIMIMRIVLMMKMMQMICGMTLTDFESDSII